MTIRIVLFIFLAVFSAGLQLSYAQESEDKLAQQDTVTIAYYPHPPYYDKDGEGFVTDIYREAFAAQGLKVTMIGLPIKRGITRLFTGEVDAFSPGTLFIRDPEQQAKLLFEPSFIVEVGWFHYAKNHPDQYDDFSDKLLATLGPGLSYLNPYKDKGLELVTVEDPSRSMLMVMTERVNYTALDQLSGWYALIDNDIELPDDINYTRMAESIVANLAFLKTPERSQYLHKTFVAGMLKIKQNGQYLKILESYWGQGSVPKSVLFGDLKTHGVDRASPLLIKEIIKNANRKSEN